jgi:hypothetical protein
MSDDISFPAQVARVQTLADGGLRFTFDAPESAILAAAELMTAKRFGKVLTVSCKVLKDAPEKRAEGSSSEVDSRRTTLRRDKR